MEFHPSDKRVFVYDVKGSTVALTDPYGRLIKMKVNSDILEITPSTTESVERHRKMMTGMADKENCVLREVLWDDGGHTLVVVDRSQ